MASTATKINGWYDQNGVFHPYDQAIISDPTLFHLYTVYQIHLYMVYQMVSEVKERLTLLETKIDEIKRELERLSAKK